MRNLKALSLKVMMNLFKSPDSGCMQMNLCKHNFMVDNPVIGYPLQQG